MASENISSRYDKFGILSSLLCIIHCTLLPVAFALLANINHAFSEVTHALDFIFVLVSLTAVYFSTKNSTSVVIKGALWFFVFIFIGGVLAEGFYPAGKIVAFVGSGGLIIAHFFNLRHCKKC